MHNFQPSPAIRYPLSTSLLGSERIMKSSRDLESESLKLCADLALGRTSAVRSASEANLARLAGSVLRSRLPAESARLKSAAESFFQANPGTRVSFDEAFSRGWVTALPRLRDMLTERLRQQSVESKAEFFSTKKP